MDSEPRPADAARDVRPQVTVRAVPGPVPAVECLTNIASPDQVIQVLGLGLVTLAVEHRALVVPALYAVLEKITVDATVRAIEAAGTDGPPRIVLPGPAAGRFARGA